MLKVKAAVLAAVLVLMSVLPAGAAALGVGWEKHADTEMHTIWRKEIGSGYRLDLYVAKYAYPGATILIAEMLRDGRTIAMQTAAFGGLTDSLSLSIRSFAEQDELAIGEAMLTLPEAYVLAQRVTPGTHIVTPKADWYWVDLCQLPVSFRLKSTKVAEAFL
jgi:hypothetical protein